MSGPNAEGPDTPPRVLRVPMPADPHCVRGEGEHWVGLTDAAFYVWGEGLVCPTHITEDEMLRAAP